mmetsp:Transcript_17624/g.38192  ORF Transcript_17624/g.38192 Transcript_17624/m.38192 type:complete len:283 (+) Transcript_17624:199-1047(+)
MCNADQSPVVSFFNPELPPFSSFSSSKKTNCAVRFVMKLPRYNTFKTSNAAANAIRQDNGDEKTLPRASSTSSRAMRPRPLKHRRSHSQGPEERASTRQQTLRQQQQCPQLLLQQRRTPELPIPKKGQRISNELGVEKGDLTRMYDYATWNMYERIVNARRQQRLNVDLSSHQREQPGANSNAVSQQQPLHKSSSQGDESSTIATSATIDETDRSSAASSSWSRNNSPMTFPGQAHQQGQTTTFAPTFPHLEGQRSGCHSCPPPASREEFQDEDAFIFQLDM